MKLGLVYLVHSLFFLLMDLFIFLKVFLNRKESRSQSAFGYFALIGTVLQFIASIVLCVEFKLVDFPLSIQWIIYFLLISLPVMSAYTMGIWLVRFFDIRVSNNLVKFRIVSLLPLVVFVMMNLLSYKTHWSFYLDETGYHRGTLFFLQLLIPYGYVVGLCVLVIWVSAKKRIISNANVVRFLLLYVVPPVLGSCVQIFLGPNGCFSEIGVSVALVLVYMGLYTGDAEEHRRYNDMAVFNEKLQLVNRQLRSTMMRGELQAKTVAETIHGGFKIGKYDRVFTFKYISEQLAEMLGYTVSEMMEVSGGNMANLVHREEVLKQLPAAMALASEGNLFTLNYRVRCKDGSWKHVEERGRVIQSEGAEDEVWSVIVDKDEIVQTEVALANAENNRRKMAEYNDIISNAGLGVWYVTLQDGMPSLLHGNEKFYELIGASKDSMSQEELHEYFASRIVPEDLPIFGAAIEKMKSGQFAEALYRWNHPTKGVVYNRCGGTAVRLPDGAYCLRGYHGDATEIVANEKKQEALLKDALTMAEESNRAKTAFLNNMSHDIRTPMNAILGLATLMEKEFDNPDKLKDYLAKLKKSGDFLLSLINNVLEMARIESGKTVLEELPSCLSGNTDGTMSMFDADLKERNLTISTSMDVQHDYVYVDMVKMREILINLISNAIKYSKPGGHISTSMVEVPCSRDGYAAYEFVVEDDGIGISEKFLPYIFDSFTRAQNSTESKVAGTGLGLPIVKKLVDLMGGKISVESSLGKGSKFTLYLEHRICSEADVADESSSAVKNTNDIVGRRILLAEDNDLNAEIAVTLLQDYGFVVERAENGCVCLEKLRKAGPGYYNIVLMDIQMPCKDGYEAAREIRQLEDETLRNIPIVAMTANAFEEDRRKALAAGMNAHMAKPINVDVLVKTMSAFIK